MFRKIVICAVLAGVFGVFTVGLVLMMISTGHREMATPGGRRSVVPSTRVANLLQNPSTRLAEAERLGRVKDETSLHLLAHHVWKAEDGEFRRMCIWAIGEIGTERAVQPLSTALDSGDTDTRIAATLALNRVGTERAAMFLAQATVRQREARVRAAAAEALLGMKGPGVESLLASATADKDESVRLAAVKSLAGRDSRRAHSALGLALRDDSEAVKAAAAAALAKTGAGPLADARAVFRREYREGDLIGVINLCEKLRTVEVAPVLVEALDRLDAIYGRGKGRKLNQDLVDRVGRILAAQGSGIVGPLNEAAIAGECSMLSKLAAAEGCALIGPPTVEPISARILKWRLFPDPDELRAWVRTLGRIGHPTAAAALDRAAAHEHFIPDIGPLVVDARNRIEAASGVKIPAAEPYEVVPAGDVAEPPLMHGWPEPQELLGDISNMRRKFRTPFGRSFYLRAGESWDLVTLATVYRLAADPSYGGRIGAMLTEEGAREDRGSGADGSLVALKVNSVAGFDQAWCAAAWPAVPDDFKPGVLWLWNRSAGVTNLTSAGKVFDRLGTGLDLAHAFMHYPLSPDGKSWTVEPIHPSRSLPLTWKAPAHGYYCCRDGWGDENDFVTEIFTREKSVEGQARANAGAFSIFGLGHPWVAGPAGAKGFRVQEPCVVLPDDELNERGRGEVTHLAMEDDGSGTVTIDLKDVYGVDGLRAIAVDYSGKCGAPAMIVLVDSITAGGKRLWLWQLPRGKLDEVKIDGNGFSICYPDVSMKATFISPANVDIQATRDMVRAGRLGGPHGLFEGRLDRVKAGAPAGASFFVVITFQRGTPPEVTTRGHDLDAKVTVGERTVSFDDGKIHLR